MNAPKFVDTTFCLFEFLSINIHLKFTAIQIPIAKKGVGLS
jgi:hypothetical protein